MRLDVNGTEREVEDGVTLSAMIAAFTGSARGSAAVVDGEVVPRSQWSGYTLRSGQVVELITAVQGG